ncbi:MAG: nodulation protein NfeD [Spiribacter sp.]|nr:nodulation protein NfeD [Spiribacter sp.]
MRSLIALIALLFAGPVVGQTVHVLTIDGPIGPATADYVVDGLEEAQAADVDAIVLKMDTPGGLDPAMRDIISAILDSPMPVLGHVAPSGARAASAGTYILYATHVAAMAPGTNLGAATPVRVGGGGLPGPADEGEDEDEEASNDAPESASERKMINDAVAYIRSLAELRDRNADWAERAVRDAVSLSAQAAVDENVADLVASDTADLLAQAEGRGIEINGEDLTLELQGAQIEDQAPDWRDQLLATITNPNVAYILLLVGIYGLIFELANPGALVPGVIGGISLLLALFALQALPVNFAGLGLLALGVLFMIGEALAPSFGALGIGGVLAFGLGSVLLFEAEGPGFELSIMLVGGVTAASLVIFMGTATLAMRAFQRRGVAGVSHLLDTEAEVVATEPALRVVTESERWRAQSDYDLAIGDRVKVTDINGLTLTVEPTDKRDNKRHE